MVILFVLSRQWLHRTNFCNKFRFRQVSCVLRHTLWLRFYGLVNRPWIGVQRFQHRLFVNPSCESSTSETRSFLLERVFRSKRTANSLTDHVNWVRMLLFHVLWLINFVTCCLEIEGLLFMRVIEVIKEHRFLCLWHLTEGGKMLEHFFGRFGFLRALSIMKGLLFLIVRNER
jgi:hypothetical protein